MDKSHGMKILDSKESRSHDDSMNWPSEMGISQEMFDHFAKEKYKCEHSFTENDELGYSHNSDATASIHNIYIDPTDESYKKKIELQNARKKPDIIPTLDFGQLENRPDLKPKNYKLKIDSGPKLTKHKSTNKIQRQSISNRTPEEHISFSLQDDQDSNTDLFEKTVENENSKFAENDHILIKESKGASNNLYNWNPHEFGQADLVSIKCIPSLIQNYRRAVWAKCTKADMQTQATQPRRSLA